MQGLKVSSVLMKHLQDRELVQRLCDSETYKVVPKCLGISTWLLAPAAYSALQRDSHQLRYINALHCKFVPLLSLNQYFVEPYFAGSSCE
ncbi:hypothetical protein AMECASPLE_016912, partial [Ameca splendens]